MDGDLRDLISEGSLENLVRKRQVEAFLYRLDIESLMNHLVIIPAKIGSMRVVSRCRVLN